MEKNILMYRLDTYNYVCSIKKQKPVYSFIKMGASNSGTDCNISGTPSCRRLLALPHHHYKESKKRPATWDPFHASPSKAASTAARDSTFEIERRDKERKTKTDGVQITDPAHSLQVSAEMR